MITELHVQGFKSLRDVRIPLAPEITVLVGANNSGKTAALQALELFARTLRHGTSDIFDDSAFENVVTRGADALSIKVVSKSAPEVATFTASRGSREVEVESQRARPMKLNIWLRGGPLQHVSADEVTLAGLRSLAAMRVFDLSVPALRRSSAPEQGPALAPDGSNLGSVLDALANEQPDVHERIASEVREAAKEVKRLLAPVGRDGEGKVVAIQETDGSVFRADVLSDGLLLFVALSTIAQTHSPVPTLLAFEEPDRGIHPRRIKEVVDQFRRVAAKGTQIVLTTHSPLLVNEFRDSPESIVIFDRDANGTHATRLTDKPEWKEGLFSDQPLGELWYSGLLGGVPR